MIRFERTIWRKNNLECRDNSAQGQFGAGTIQCGTIYFFEHFLYSLDSYILGTVKLRHRFSCAIGLSVFNSRPCADPGHHVTGTGPDISAQPLQRGRLGATDWHKDNLAQGQLDAANPAQGQLGARTTRRGLIFRNFTPPLDFI